MSASSEMVKMWQKHVLLLINKAYSGQTGWPEQIYIFHRWYLKPLFIMHYIGVHVHYSLNTTLECIMHY